VKILVVRRDNIGDLVLTTPVFRALRERFPGASLEALVTSYSAPILEKHPDVDRVHAYTKSKHTGSSGAAFTAWAGRLRQMVSLRDERFDYVILPAPGFHPRSIRLARFLGPGHVVAFLPPGMTVRGVDLPADDSGRYRRHHLESTYFALTALGIDGPPPAPRLAVPVPPRRAGAPLTIGVHVSARRPRNRWPEGHHGALIRELHARFGAQFRLYWAPGAEDDPRHPGDDGKARRILAHSRPASVQPVATHRLSDLVASLASCDVVVCSDGGAMHVAAALGKPVVCFFGDSDAAHWHPWAVPYRLLQPASRDASDVPAAAAVEAFEDLARETGLARAA